MWKIGCDKKLITAVLVRLCFTGAPQQQQQQRSGTMSSSTSPDGSPPPPFVPGDRVRMTLELEIFKMMQEGHGSWNEQMNEVR